MNRIKLLNLYKSATTLITPLNKNIFGCTSNRLFIANYCSSTASTTVVPTQHVIVDQQQVDINNQHKLTTSTTPSTTSTVVPDTPNKLQLTENINVKPYFENVFQFNEGPIHDESLTTILSTILFKYESNSKLQYNVILSKLISVKKIENEIKNEMVLKVQSIDDIKLAPIKIFLLSVSVKEIKSKEQKIIELINQVEQQQKRDTNDQSISTLLKYCNYSNWFGKTMRKEAGGGKEAKKSKLIKTLEYLKLNSNDTEFQSIFKGNSKFLQILYIFKIHEEFSASELKELQSTTLFSKDNILNYIYSTIYSYPIVSSLWARMYILLGYPFEEHMYLDIQNAIFTKNQRNELYGFRAALNKLGYYPTTFIDEQYFSSFCLIAPYRLVIRTYQEMDHLKNFKIQTSMIKFLLEHYYQLETEQKKQTISLPKLDSTITAPTTTITTKKTKKTKNTENTFKNPKGENLILFSILENNKSIQLYNYALNQLINGTSSNGDLIIFRRIIQLLTRESELEGSLVQPNYETLDIVYQFFSKFKRFNDKQMFIFINQFSTETNTTLSESDQFNLSIKIAILKKDRSLAMELLSELYKLGLSCYKSTMDLLIKTDPLNSVWVNFYKQQQTSDNQQSQLPLIDSNNFLSIKEPVALYNHLISNSIEINDSTCLNLIYRLLKENETSLIGEIIENKFSNNQYFKNQNNLLFLKRLISIPNLPISEQDLIQFESILLSESLPEHEQIRNTSKLLELAVSRNYNELYDKYNNILNSLLESSTTTAKKYTTVPIDLVDPTNSKSLLYLNLVSLQSTSTSTPEKQDQFISKYIDVEDLNDPKVKYSILLAFYHMVTGLFNRGINQSDTSSSPLSSSEFYLKIRSKLNLNPDEPIVDKLLLEIYVLDKIILSSFQLFGKYYTTKQSKSIIDNPLFSVGQLEKIIISKIKFIENTSNSTTTKQLKISKLLSHFIGLSPKIGQINQFYNCFIENPTNFKYLDEPTIKYLLSLGSNEPELIENPFYTVFVYKYYLSIDNFATAFNHYFVNVSPFIQYLILDKQLSQSGTENPFTSKLLSAIESKEILLKPISNLLRVSTISNSPSHFEFSCLLFNKLIDIQFNFIPTLIQSKDLLFTGTSNSKLTTSLVDKDTILKIKQNVKLSNPLQDNQDITTTTTTTTTIEPIELSMNSHQCVLKIKEMLNSGSSLESIRSFKLEMVKQKVQLSLIDKCKIYIMVNECSIIQPHKLQPVLRMFRIDVPPTHLFSNDKGTNKLLFSMGLIKKFEELFSRVNNTYYNNPYVPVDKLFKKFKPEYQTFDIKNNPKDILSILKYYLNQFK